MKMTSTANGDAHICCSEGIECFLSSATSNSAIEAVSKLLPILEGRFQFPEITSERKNKLADKLARSLKDDSLNSADRCKLVQLVRIISRDKSDIDSFATDALLDALLTSAGLKSALHLDEIESKNEEYTQALKSLCNLVFNCRRAREIIGKADINGNLLNRIKNGATQNLPFVLRCFDMRLAFLLSALDPQLRKVLRVQYDGIDSLSAVLDGCMAKYDQIRGYSDEDVDLMCESLKILFNLCSTIDRDGQVYEANELEKLEHLGEMVRKFLLSKCETAAKSVELQSNSLNLMTGMPVSIYKQLLIAVDESQPKRLKIDAIPYYDGFDMRAVDSLVNFLDRHIDKELKATSESIIPVLTLLVGIVQNVRPIRKYLRFKILPPLKDVMERPEIGNTVRNKLCRLMTHSSVEVKHAAANFLYELCKKNVDRLIKYTGFGNAAGLLADFGLFGTNLLDLICYGLISFIDPSKEANAKLSRICKGGGGIIGIKCNHCLADLMKC